eukprot:CAMPEP_0178518636 /NCGR_PEP_ID=MMETSP0696-20121128/26374_1 /TAXON_ID=265572 /ORGANISM="Extubocellulus spinifer, Strain CCMP396" /LENGTH=209 /DNA_ID=CAMNT_0020149235 /DNA_START=362 /DNA_END=988 /DNA_ORIENTATION=-
MSGGQEEKIPLYLRAKDDDPMGLDIICSWLSHNNHNEYCDYLTEMSMDQAALLLSCCKLLRLIVKEGRAEVKPLVQAHIMANTLYINNQDEFVSYLTDYCTDQAALLLSVTSFLRSTSRPQQPGTALLLHAPAIANACSAAFEDVTRSSPLGFTRGTMMERMKTISVKIMQEAGTQAKEPEAANSQNDDAKEQDEIAKLKAQLKRQEED